MRRRHNGFTLIELSVVLTVLSLVWLSITCVLYTLHRADHRLRDELKRENALDRFAIRLRLDAHAASSANLLELVEGRNELVLSTVEQRFIHYGVSDEGIHRVVREGDSVLHRDTFLTGRAKCDWELQPADDASLIVLTLTPRDGRTASLRVRQIKAAVTSAARAIAGTAEKSS